ncbi:HAMP domain-containing protein [Streptomyces sp. NBS 14/10]|uniref:HAMP domain-containing protein n=1 Tax=Streptomyces sp. NBS 14/10 TaxID=1945643 RepID=UPI000B7D5A22|nr:HAMP domain-containing protein [Streptomyces sp. NBS 14/10]KAK1186081.1 HAMP domain-containing protein [Streptomyces sp. NBS 14/10]
MSLIGGIRPPIAVLSALLLSLAGITALTFGKTENVLVPKAVLTSQQHFAEDGAVALRASLDESVTDLDRTAILFSEGKPVSADAVLDKTGSVYQKWSGTAVIEIKSGKLLAARGETVPLTVIDRTKLSGKDGLKPRLVRLQNGQTRLIALALLSWKGQPQQLLIASSNLKVPGMRLSETRGIGVVDSTGTILSSDGALDSERAQAELKDFATISAKKSRQNPISSKEPGSGGYAGVSGSLTGDASGDRRTVAGYASLAAAEPGESTVASGLGLSIVTQVGITERASQLARPAFGLAAAGALLVIGGLAIAVLLGTVQRPLIRLFLESRRLTRGDLARPVTVPRFGEAARIGRALERLRQQLRGEAPEDADGTAGARGGRRLGTRALVAVSAVLLLTWSVPLTLLLNRPSSSVHIPAQVVADQKARTETISDRVRRALNEGHADLSAIAALIGNRTSAEDMADVLDRTIEEHPRYESVYVLSGDGEVLARAGDDPHHSSGERPADQPLKVSGHGGKKPVIRATAPLQGKAGAAVVGEFDIDFVNALLRRDGLGQVRVIDAEGRTIAGNSGYLAFEKMPGHLSPLVDRKQAHAKVQRGDDVRIAAAAPMTGGGAAKVLDWSVVSWQPASRLDIPAYTLQNRTVLVGLLGLTAAAACLGWLHIVVVRPLRALADQAEALAGGDRRTVLFPRHHDEVGAVVRSLELIRQQLQEQQRGGRDGSRSLAGRN